MPDIPDSQVNVLYAVYDSAGAFVRQGRCSLEVLADQAHEPGHTSVRVQEPVVEPEQPLTWKQQRRASYPKLTDQLDAFWKGGAEADSMRADILAVKARFPKP